MFKRLLFLFALTISCFSFSQGFNTIWNTTNPGTSANNEITIPTNPAYTYNYDIDWGDGASDTNVTGDITHTYTAPGTYTVSITGTFPAIYFNNGGDREKIIEILAWGTNQWQTMEDAFHGCTNLNFDAIDSPDLSQVTSLKNMFRRASAFNGIINNWNVSTITDISGMFADAIIFNRPVDNWNTIAVTDMSETFLNARAFNEPLDNWNTASVTNMSFMLSGASAFNQNINNWDVSLVTNMSGMFRYTNSFNFPLNNWNVTNVTDMSQMFEGSAFNLPLNSWDVSNVIDMSGMFSQYSHFNQNINNWVVSSVTDMSDMFMRATQFNQPLDGWDVSSVTDMSGMFDGFIVAMIFNQPLNSWDVSNVTNMAKMFRDCRDFNQPLDNWNVSLVTDMSQMFEDAEVFDQDISGWDVSGVMDMRNMFQETDAFNQDLNIWDVSAVTNMSNMFFRASQFDLPLDTWDVSSVALFGNMFAQSVFNQDISGWDTSSATNMSTMFSGASTFDQNLASWDVSGVTNMANMLSNSGLSQENYDNALIGWAAQAVQDNVNLGATSLTYCDGRDARQELIDDHNWNITGDSINCSFVTCTSFISPQDGETNVPANFDLRWNPAPNATGYYVSVRVDRGGSITDILNNSDEGNVVGIDFTSDFLPGDIVYATVVPYNAEGPATGCAEISFTVVANWNTSPDAFLLTIDTRNTDTSSTPANQLRLETNYEFSGDYNYSIDWGDNQFDNNVTGEITHTYLNPGVYTIAIIGDYPAHYYLTSNRDNQKLLSIDQWGTQQWQSMRQSFYYCTNMTYAATDVPDLSQVTNMSSMFGGASMFNGNINNWDVSNVTEMSGTFIAATDYNQPLDNWNVSNVTNMGLMFLAARSFDQPLDGWDVRSAVDMSRMFEQAEIFNQPLNSWDVSNVTNMEGMFERAEAFNQPLNNWDVSNVTNMIGMFDGFVTDMAFNQNLDSWNVGNVTNMAEMFRRCVAFDQPLNSWNVSNVTNMASMFNSASSFNQPLNNWDVSSVTDMFSMFSGASTFNQNIDSWSVTNVTMMRSMFASAIVFNQPLNSWDVNSVVDMSYMFFNAEAFDQPLDNWNVSAVANMSSMFEDAILFNQPINTWDVSSVTLMESMFETAELFNQPLNNWDVASVTQFAAMFKDANLFDQALGNWDTGEALTMAEMFYGAAAFDQNIDGWNTSFVTTMESMFRDAVTYNQSMNSWNVASVTTMRSMFQGAAAFNGTISSWNVRGVLTMENMFNGASTFNQDINNWRVFNVTNMNYMFRNASAYNQPMEQWDLGAVTMRSMFEDATAFDQYLGDWDVSSVSNMQNMLDDTALTRENYDNTLIAWSEQTLTPGINLGANTLLYCDALEERQSMIDTYGWSFSGDVLDCPVPACTQLVSPLSGDTDVPVNTNLTWDPVLYATGYYLTVGTTPGGNDIANNEDVTDTTYDFPTDFTGGETVYVTIIPYNGTGNPTVCTEESFTISSTTTPTPPDCTQLVSPLSGAVDVVVDTDLEWQPIANANGYRITVGTSTGATDILNDVDVGNVTIRDLPTDLPEDTEIFVSIIPYNDEGDATPCAEESFTTEIIPVPPACTSLNNPFDGATNIPVDTNISWDAVAEATGYLVIVGITQDGIEVANNIDVGNVTTYDFPADLQENRTHYVTIIPYNDVGDAMGCAEESFRTGSTTLNDPPACTTLSSPLNGATDVAIDTDLMWNSSANTDGYRLTVGTSSGGNDILNNVDVGNVTTYDLPSDLPEGTTIFVTIVPYNSFGDATPCAEESFTTDVPQAGCPNLITPAFDATNVPVNTNFTWNVSANAVRYTVGIGTATGMDDILTITDVGNVTSFDPPSDLPSDTRIFVTITAYNSADEGNVCGDDQFTTAAGPTEPTCTTLSIPLDGSTDVAISTDLTWNTVSNADGYRVSVRDGASASYNILDNFDVGNINTHDFTNDLPPNSDIYVLIVPYNSVGDAMGCTEEHFVTGDVVVTVPECTNLSIPLNLSIDVPVDTDIVWDAVSDADGYRLTVGTSAGLGDILNDEDVGNVTSYDLPNDLLENTEIFVFVQPYNSVGDAEFCEEESFITGTAPQMLPSCTTLATPENGADDVAIDTNITWNEVAEATGYRITVGTSSGRNDILDNEDVGLITSYDFMDDFSYSQQIFVTIIPYNTDGDAFGCAEESFTTIEEPEIESLFGFSPDNDGINDYWEINGIEDYPNNTVMIFNRWGDLVFKIEGYDNASNAFYGEANQLTGMGAGQLPEGTYFFQINIPGDHNLRTTQGYLVLKR
ncbi:BspA family leucine-rich repeat surface protein [Allomuricauda sp. d1]|uniref:BspA family leucine-rich repeat surface protein n=1 Tax=Allomuricauda sp. d1 TaxID=3136725 RepID=UPI0031CE59B3